MYLSVIWREKTVKKVKAMQMKKQFFFHFWEFLCARGNTRKREIPRINTEWRIDSCIGVPSLPYKRKLIMVNAVKNYNTHYFFKTILQILFWFGKLINSQLADLLCPAIILYYSIKIYNFQEKNKTETGIFAFILSCCSTNWKKIDLPWNLILVLVLRS